jgi:uncharacterized protein YgbK (DUF1537 family)
MNTHVKIGIITHDLISAVRGSEKFTHYGFIPTIVIDEKPHEDLDVIAITTMSKIETPRIAYLGTMKAISQCHGRYLYFQENKFLMGNISADVKAIFDKLNPAKLIFCTSFPQENSFIKGAQGFVGDVPADKSVQATDKITPIKESYIPDILKRDTGLAPKLISIADVEQGSANITRLVNNCPNRIIICDATQPSHLINIAKAIVENLNSWIACGSNGLTRAMVPLLVNKKQNKGKVNIHNDKPILLILGSISDVTALQLATAVEKGLVTPILVEPGDLLYKDARDRKIRELVAQAYNELAKGNNVAITTTVSRFMPKLRKKTSYLLSQIANNIAAIFDPTIICISGSDTSYALCKTMNIQKLEILGSINEGLSSFMVKAHAVNGKKYWFCLKPGSSGDELEVVRMLQFLRR